MSFPKLIECGDHQFAPYAATCVHVIQRTTADIVPVRCKEGGKGRGPTGSAPSVT